MDNQHTEATNLGIKILVGILAIVSFRWVAKIFAGSDGKFSTVEFGKFTGFLFFLTAGGYMLWTEGNRGHEWHLYSEWYIAIVFGSLLTVLHLDYALDKILKIMQAIVEMRRSKGQPAKQEQSTEQNNP